MLPVGNGLETVVWRSIGNGLETVWKRFGNGLETVVCGRIGNGLETVWKRFGNPRFCLETSFVQEVVLRGAGISRPEHHCNP